LSHDANSSKLKTIEQWALLEPLLQRADGPGRPAELDLRTVVNALLYT
jgi:transposase